MGQKRTDEFRADAVRIALTSGLTRKQVADDLGVGMSTLNIEHKCAIGPSVHAKDHSPSGHRCGVERGSEPRPRE